MGDILKMEEEKKAEETKPSEPSDASKTEVKEEAKLPEKSDAKQAELPSYKYDEKKTMDENASDLAELKATGEAIQDEEFIKKVAEKKKEQISASADLNKDIRDSTKTAEKIEAATKIDQAFYEQWKTVFQWGGMESACKKPFMIFMLFLILPFFVIEKCCFELPVAIIKSFLGAINALLEKIKTFGKIARGIAFSLLILGVIALAVYIILFYLDKYGILSIF